VGSKNQLTDIFLKGLEPRPSDFLYNNYIIKNNCDKTEILNLLMAARHW
jgi:hypothetical protein